MLINSSNEVVCINDISYYFCGSQAEDETRKFLQTTIENYYSPQNNKSDAVSLMWNFLMAQVKRGISIQLISYPELLNKGRI